MKTYFSPDINSLREIPEAARKEILGLVTESAEDPAPDVLLVDQLLHMIRFAQSSRAVPAGC